MDQADKLLNNPIRLVVVSNLHQVASADFTALIELTGATKGNLSIQLNTFVPNSSIVQMRLKSSFKTSF